MKAARHVSYAASIGKSEFNEVETEEFQKLAERLDKVSVREKTAALMIAPILNREVFVALDPTLLLDKNDWSKISIAPKKAGKYLLVYEVACYRETMTVAKKVAKELGLPIVELKYTKTKISYDHLCINDCGPEEFVGWFENAEFIVTSSFHGTAFSIIYRKNFYTVPHKQLGSRMVDLLNSIGLASRIIRNTDVPDVTENVSYEIAVPLLEKQILGSIAYLKSSCY